MDEVAEDKRIGWDDDAISCLDPMPLLFGEAVFPVATGRDSSLEQVPSFGDIRAVGSIAHPTGGAIPVETIQEQGSLLGASLFATRFSGKDDKSHGGQKDPGSPRDRSGRHPVDSHFPWRAIQRDSLLDFPPRTVGDYSRVKTPSPEGEGFVPIVRQ